MRNYFFAVLMGFFTCVVQAQSIDNMSVDSLNKRMTDLFNQSAFVEALPYAEKAVEKAKALGNDSIYADNIGNLAALYLMLGRMDEAEPLFLSALEIIVKTKGKNTSNYSNNLANLAVFYKTSAQYEKAEPLYLEALEIDSRLLGKEHPDYANNVNNLATLYHDLGRFEEAEPLYIEAKNVWKKTLGDEDPDYAAVLNNLALLYHEMGRMEEAEPLIVESVRISKKVLGSQNLGYASTLVNLARLYQDMGRNKDAAQLFLEVLSVKAKHLGKEHIEYAMTTNSLAYVYQNMKRWKESETLLKQAMCVYQKNGETEHPNYAVILHNLAYNYLNTQQLDSALAYSAACIAANSPDIDQEKVDFLTVDKFSYYYYDQTIKSLAMVLNILDAQYQQNQQQSILLQRYEICKTIMRIKEQVGNEFTQEASKLRLSANNNNISGAAIKMALALKSPKYHAEAFGFAEQNKALLLADALKGSRARNLGDLPDSLINKEIQLHEQISQLKKQKSSSLDSLAKMENTQQMNLALRELDAFKKSIKEKYPKYHQLKYKNISAKASDIQALLDKNSLFLEYLVSDSAIFLFVLTAQNLDIISLEMTNKELNFHANQLRNALSDYVQIKEKEELNYKNYSTSASWLYDKLLATALKKYPSHKNLIIITDGVLGHLPFETFLLKPATGKTSDYTRLHYLVNEYAVSYNYSATLWKENSVAKPKKLNNKVLAMAASYNKKETVEAMRRNRSNAYSNAQLRNLRDALNDLPAAKLEVEGLSKHLDGQFLFGEAANEAAFKKNAGNYGIIHLAMHGLLNQRSPILSSLAFTENGDSLEDNFLEAWEIAHLHLNAQLVVLSACETGYGKFEQGEGVMSLARSFMYAGVPSLVVSLWQVNDASTAHIMQLFYKQLGKGSDKAEALRQAKLEYIRSVEDPTAAHPAFWAPFIIIGDARPISVALHGSFGAYLPWAIGGGLLAAALGIYALRRKKSV